MDTISVIQYGLGPIGTKVTQYIAAKKHLAIAGGIDIAPDKVGKDIGELAGLTPLGVKVTADADALLKASDAQVVVLTTTSDLAKIKPQILQCVNAGKNVVTTCEELAYPWQTAPAIAKEIDEAAWKNEVSVLATGVNPGFLMDFLPLALTAVCKDVEQITVERIQDAQFRRVPFQKKIGAGLTTAAFQAKIKDGSLRHVGLTESMHMIAAAMGWKLDKTEDIIEPIIAEKETVTDAMTVKQGDARGVAQTGRGWIGSKEAITLVFRAAIAEPDPRDRIVIKGTPGIDSTIKGGVNGDVATCAITVNAIAAIVKAAPGLRTMQDIAPIACSE